MMMIMIMMTMLMIMMTMTMTMRDGLSPSGHSLLVIWFSNGQIKYYLLSLYTYLPPQMRCEGHTIYKVGT